ncbi:hypothetical protein AwWohl_06110 [Gammaproteobacteria bacterium]|nr:hypothetical protein AwWohl_06110 [Gammaproteobacteria bacterium]
MVLMNLLKGFLPNLAEAEGFKYQTDSKGINFLISPERFAAIQKGKADPLITTQFAVLKMLAEQGSADIIPNGFIVPSEHIVHLDEDMRQLLKLPHLWQGSLKADIEGESYKPNFKVNLYAIDNAESATMRFKILGGAIISFSKQREYSLTPAQYMVFQAQEIHKLSDKTEFDNLSLIKVLQDSQKIGLQVDLAHFAQTIIHIPTDIFISSEKNQQGDLILTPTMGQNASIADINLRLGQLDRNHSKTLRVGKEIILFTEPRLKAFEEIMKNRIIPQKDVEEFLKSPTAFIDASLIDFDTGFSMRVQGTGATIFKHHYFGMTDASGINWFDGFTKSETICPLESMKSVIKDLESLEKFKQEYEDAQKTGAFILEFEGNSFDIRNKENVHAQITLLENTLTNKASYDLEHDDTSNIDTNAIDTDTTTAKEAELKGILVLDIDLNDTDVKYTINEKIKDVLSKRDLDLSEYKRKCYPHQEIGIKWILGLVENTRKNKKEYLYGGGGLLADDMGLGKTYMALAAIEHLYKQNDLDKIVNKPTLVVAPLSLLENWKDEVENTFKISPFADIVILQADADLKKYKQAGSSIEIRGQAIPDDLQDESLQPNYSLKWGKKHGNERLDMPARLVLVTYQTLRDYMFSLCKIDWGMVVFDEAQNIKNPNILQTRAAKGLKADFKLLVTGTPVENSLVDFWCLMDTAFPNLLGAYQEFKQEYIKPIINAASDELDDVRESIGIALRLKVGALMLRRVKEDELEGLPQKHIYVGTSEKPDHWYYSKILESIMLGSQKKAYEGLITAGTSVDIQTPNKPEHVLSLLRNLQLASLHPKLLEKNALMLPDNPKELKTLLAQSAKIQSLLTVLEQIKSRNEKCIIFVLSKRLQLFLSVALGQLFALGSISIINGDTAAIDKNKANPKYATKATRKSIIAEFEATAGFNIIIMSPIAAGVGLTVVGANNVIHFERHWNPAKEAQATDRVHRIGQKKEVNVYIPLLHHPNFESFDINLHRLLSRKSLLKDAVVTVEDVRPAPEGINASFKLEPNAIITQQYLHRLSWQEFEALVVEVFAKKYHSEDIWLTSNGSDNGADGVLISQGNCVLIQAKHTKSEYDGYKAIREIYAAKPLYENALNKNIDTLVFVTNATKLSKRSKEHAKICGVSIISGHELSELLAQYDISYAMVIARLNKVRMTI